MPTQRRSTARELSNPDATPADTPAPQDHLPANAGEAVSNYLNRPRTEPEMFRWTSPGGTEVAIPRLDQMNSGLIRQHRRRDSLDFLYTMLEETSSAETLKTLDSLVLQDVNDLFGEWMAKTGAKLGE